MKRLLIISSLLLLGAGFLGFISGALIATGVIKYDGELPLGDIQGFAVDTAGTIYIASGGYGAVQSYSSEGRFLHQWSAKANGGSFSIGLNKEQQIVAYTVRDPRMLVFEPDVRLISESGMKIDIMAQGNSPTTIEANNARYDLIGGLFPRVDRKTSSTTTIVDQPLYLDLIKSPMPAWLLFAIGLVANMLLKKDELLAKLHGQRA